MVDTNAGDKPSTPWQMLSERWRWFWAVVLGILSVFCFVVAVSISQSDRPEKFIPLLAVIAPLVLTAVAAVANSVKPREEYKVLDAIVESSRARADTRASAATAAKSGDSETTAVPVIDAEPELADRLRSAEAEVESLTKAVEQLSQLSEWQKLWSESREWMAQYHKLALRQGERSFRWLMLFSAIGFTLLVSVVVVATRVKTTAGGIAIGAAGAVGGALTAYISRTFMRAYQEANYRLDDYFRQPLEMSRALAAERLLSNVSDLNRDAAATSIIESMVDHSVKRSRQPSVRKPRKTTIDVTDRSLSEAPAK